MVKHVLATAKPGDIGSVFEAIDTFCMSEKNNWLMNIGPGKAEACEPFMTSQPIHSFLELGTYVGYSGIRFSRLLEPKGRLVTIDVNEKTTALAKRMAEFAGVTNMEFLLGGLEPQLEHLKKEFPKGFDVVFLDHWKTLYTPDLKLLEQAGLVRVGTRVVADNLKRPGNPAYIEYMTDHEHYEFKINASDKTYRGNVDEVGLSLCVKPFK